jgi:hypothetical protein
VADVALRPIDDSDLDALFDQMRDPESVRMAAFTAKDPNDYDLALCPRQAARPEQLLAGPRPRRRRAVVMYGCRSGPGGTGETWIGDPKRAYPADRHAAKQS